MRVVIAAADADAADWVAHTCGAAGVSAVVLPDPHASSPELAVADLLVVDRRYAADLAATDLPRVLLAPRGTTLELDEVRAGFADVLVVPSDVTEAVARLRHAAGDPP